MQFRGFKARWYFEYYNLLSNKWLVSKRFYDGTWEDAVTALSELVRHRAHNSPDKFRVSPIAVLEE